MSPPQSAPSHPSAPLLVTVPEAAELLGIGRSKLYELILDGTIATVHIGRARRVPVSAVHEYIAALQAQAETDAHRTDTLRTTSPQA